MRLVEFRILMPLTVEENYIGQLWSMSEASRLNTGGGEGVEILKNEFFPIPNEYDELKNILPDYELNDEEKNIKKKEKKLHSSKSLGALSKYFKRESSTSTTNNNASNGHKNEMNDSVKDDYFNNENSNNSNNNSNNKNNNESHKLVKNNSSNSDEISMYSSLPNSMGSVESMTTKFDKTYINKNNNDDSSSTNSEISTRKGQYTHKLYKIASKFPWFIRTILPKESTMLYEKSWNLYPIIKTHIRNEYMKDKFHVFLNTITKECVNGIFEDNVHNLTVEQLEKREIVIIDIAEPVSNREYIADEDPAKFRSVKAKRGPLTANWISTQRPLICCYKLVELEFVWLGLQGKAENYMVNMYKKLFKKFHRQIFCWLDKWYDLKIEDVRKYEADLQKSLTEKINHGEISVNPFEIAEN